MFFRREIEIKEVTLCLKRGGEEKTSRQAKTAWKRVSYFLSPHHLLWSGKHSQFIFSLRCRFLHKFLPIFLYTFSSVFCANKSQPHVGDTCRGESQWPREVGSSPTSFHLGGQCNRVGIGGIEVWQANTWSHSVLILNLAIIFIVDLLHSFWVFKTSNKICIYLDGRDKGCPLKLGPQVSVLLIAP